MQKPVAFNGFAEVNGAQLYYQVQGSGHPVVLLHAGIADSRMWEDQFALWAERYQVIRYDNRGFGRSTMPPGPFAWRDDLAELLRLLDISRAALVGASMGGAAAIDLALTRPDLVEALVLVGSGLGGMEAPYTSEEERLFSQVEVAGEAGDFGTANDLEVHIWVDGPTRDPKDVAAGVRERVREMNLQTFLRHDEFEQAQPLPLEPPASARLVDIQAPTLVVVGEQDLNGIQGIADHLATTIPSARKVTLPNTAHVPNMERTETFNRLVLDFFESIGW
jgi:3-oxoadipate enol-lactonase